MLNLSTSILDHEINIHVIYNNGYDVESQKFDVLIREGVRLRCKLRKLVPTYRYILS